MRANRRTDTKPELALRSALHRQGYRFRKDYRLDLVAGARVRPDIAFTARRVAVFVDGCFWHACPEHGRNPAVNEWYWAPKLRRTMERDRAADAALAAAGWRVVRIWEHVPLADAVAAVTAALGAGELSPAKSVPLGARGGRLGSPPGRAPPARVSVHVGLDHTHACLPARDAARTGRSAA
jgi:DNA mismatch endonuclease (patch repair protein)